jgi:hypothetical protein
MGYIAGIVAEGIFRAKRIRLSYAAFFAKSEEYPAHKRFSSVPKVDASNTSTRIRGSTSMGERWRMPASSLLMLKNSEGCRYSNDSIYGKIVTQLERHSQAA